MMTLTEYRIRWKAALRGSFFEAAWDGAEAAELIRSAEAAGLSMELADRLRDEVGELKAAIPAATEHADRQQALERAKVAFEARRAKAAARISAIEDEVDQAGMEVARLSSAAAEAEDAVVFLATSDLVPPAVELPAAVLQYRQKHEARLVRPPRPWQKNA